MNNGRQCQHSSLPEATLFFLEVRVPYSYPQQCPVVQNNLIDVLTNMALTITEKINSALAETRTNI